MNRAHQLRFGDMFALAVFLAVADHKSFRSAAIALEVTPSAVSHSVKALERQLGVRLLNRTTRSMALTVAGAHFATQLRPALASIEEAVRVVGDLGDTPSGTIRINASEGAIQIVLRPILASFLQKYPQVQLDIVNDGRLSDVIDEGFDAGIRLKEAVPKDMIAVQVSDDIRFLAVASPAYFATYGKPTAPRNLLDHECIRFRFDSGSIYRWEFEREGKKEAIDVKGRLTLTDQKLMVEAATDGIGIAFVPDHLTYDGLKSGRLQTVLEEWCPAYPGLCLYYSGHRHVSSALLALISTIRRS
ncbi:LysR family transcriptional regulator [Comamonas sp. 4034]|uniref:LysR family transcriptional regulator n=1 Tax=Comamonas sp. 4034 TaxID=3156455 RepID=UPI003D1DC3A1